MPVLNLQAQAEDFIISPHRIWADPHNWNGHSYSLNPACLH